MIMTSHLIELGNTVLLVLFRLRHAVKIGIGKISRRA